MLPALTALLAFAGAGLAGLALVCRRPAGPPVRWPGRRSRLWARSYAVAPGWPARLRGGYYTAQELAELDMPALALAVGRTLRRDGWRVSSPARHDALHLAARDDRGRLLDVAFRPVAEPLPDEEACSCRARLRSRERAGPPLRLVVHRGAFTHRDEVWAAREGHTYLIDGPRLRLWARGTPLAQLVAGAVPAPRRT